MRILFITHFYPKKYNAGTEHYTMSLAQAYLSLGHLAEVICVDTWNTGDHYWNGVSQEDYSGIKVHRVHLNWQKAENPNQALYTSQPAEEWLDGFLQKNQFDIVHVTSTYTLGVAVFRSVKRAGLPLILTLMDFWFLCPTIQLFTSQGATCNGKTSAWDCQSCMLPGSHLLKQLHSPVVPENLLAPVLGWAAKVPFLTRMRGLRGHLLDIDERKRLLGEALTLPDIILSHSSTVKQLFDENGSADIQVLTLGHDIHWKDLIRRNNRNGVIRFGFMGQIQLTKGVHILIEAFNKANINGKAHLSIWGDLSHNTPYIRHIIDLAADTANISLHGRFERPQLPEVLSNIDVLIVPSIWYENAPLVIQEAFAARIPVITTNLGGMAEAVTDEVNGLLFERGNAGDLASKLVRVVNEPGLLERLQSGIPEVKQIEEEANQLLDIYHKLLDTMRTDPLLILEQTHQ
jgi:glycosyltransferase involved in cell wall biosynthesis